jgi:2'-5' RNA ligase
LSPETQAFYSSAIGAIVEAHADILRPIPVDSAHITATFLPRVDPAFVGLLQDAVAAVAARHLPVAIGLGVPFVLTSGSEARLICAGVGAGAAPLSALLADLMNEVRPLQERGLEVRGTKSLHVTLARCRKGTPRGQTRSIETALRDRVPARTETISALQLMASKLTSTGPVYEILQQTSLGRS